MNMEEEDKKDLIKKVGDNNIKKYNNMRAE